MDYHIFKNETNKVRDVRGNSEYIYKQNNNNNNNRD